jgi:hypothetical protein
MTSGTGRSSNRVTSRRGTWRGKDIQDDLLRACGVDAVSPRAIDKRARPGNEDRRTTVPPGDLTAVDESTEETDPAARLDSVEKS